MAMNNPFLVRKPKNANTNFSLGSELRRLFGSPLRAPLTLLLVLVPLLLSLAGAVDFVQGWLYSISHKGAADKRQVAFFVDCLTNNPTAKAICAGQKIGRSKMQFWPFMPVTTPLPNGDTASSFFGLGRLLGQPQPIWFLGLFLLAVMAFVGIGNPNLSRIGPLLADAFGFKPRTKTRTKAKKLNDKNEGVTTDLDTTTNKAIERFEHDLLPPPRLTDEKELPFNWIVGGTLLREWTADPGLFYLKQDKLTGPKNVLNERPPYFLVGDTLRTNLMIVAPQGSGKTTSVFRPAINFIRRSGGVGCIWDSKGNDFNPADFTYNFDLEDFERSFHLCVFSGRTPEEAGERLAEAMIPELSEDKRYFSDIAKDALAAIVAGHHAVYERFPELTQILLYINKDGANLEELIEVIPARVENKDEIERLMGNLVRVQTLIEIKGDLLGNLRTALTPLTSPQISRFLAANPDPANKVFTIEGLLTQPGLIRLGLPVADRPRIAPILGRLILAQFVFAVLSPRCNQDILKLAVVDEAHNFVSLPICKGMAQARSNNAGFMLAFQTLSQIPNDSMLETIFSLAGTKIVMGGVGNKDARRFSDTFGKVWLEFVSHSTNTGRSTNSNTGGSRTSGSFMEFGTSSESGSSSKSTTNYGRSSSKSTGTSENTQLHERALFSDYDIRTLPQHHGIIESANTYGERWQAQIIDMSQNTVKALETAFVGEVSRLLSDGKGKDKKKDDKDKSKKKKDNDTDEEPESHSDNNGWNGPRPGLGPGPAQPSTLVVTTDLALREPEPARVINAPTSPRSDWPSSGGVGQPSQPHEQGQGHKQSRVRFSVVEIATTALSSSPTTSSSNGKSTNSKTILSHPATACPSQGQGQKLSTGQGPEVPSIQELTTTVRNRDKSLERPSTDILGSNFIRPAQEIKNVEDTNSIVKFEPTNVGDGSVLTQQKQSGQSELLASSDSASLPATELICDSTVVFERIKQSLMGAGVAQREVERLANTVLNNRRDYAYVTALIAHPKQASLPAWLNYAITHNLPPTTTGDNKPNK